MKNFLNIIWEITQTILIALLIVIPIRLFLFQPFLVKGQSMEHNFHDGNYLIVDEISYRFRNPQRGEVIVFKYPYDTSKRFIKRIIALPNEKIKIANGKITISDKEGKTVLLDEQEYLSADIFTAGNLEVQLNEGEFFVLGDNRFFSSDSRTWGIVPKKNIIGRVYVRIFPFSQFSLFSAPRYNY